MVTCDYISTLRTVLAEERPSGAYYYGHARLDVLRLLVAMLPVGAVQAMALRAEPAEADMRELLRQGVMLWSEGGHPAELLIRDYRWSSRDQLRKVVEWGGRHPPRVYFLAGDAVDVDRHDSYTWMERDGCLIGRQKEPNKAVWQSQDNTRKSRHEWAQQLAERPRAEYD